MTEFNKGDRVEYRSVRNPFNSNNGRKGTIIGKGDYGPHIQYDDGSLWLEYPYPENVHLLNEPTEPTDAPAILRAKAADVRNLRDETYAEVDRLRDEASILHDEALALEQAATILEKIK